MPCSTGLRECAGRRPQCGHLQLVDTYRDQRACWELQREADNPGMYETEVREWEQANPGPTFREFLLAFARRPDRPDRPDRLDSRLTA